MDAVKKPWQSKTVILNAIMALASVVAIFLPAASGVPAWIQGHAEIVGGVWGVLNIALRFITKDKISLTD